MKKKKRKTRERKKKFRAVSGACYIRVGEPNGGLTATQNYTVRIKDVALQELFIQQPRVV